MALILLRHAPPPREYHRCYLGHTDVAIDAALFDETKIAPLLDERFDRIISSDLLRCTQTLDAIGLYGYSVDPRLREVRFRTSFEGKTFEQIEQTKGYDPAVLDSQERWHDFVCDESREEFRNRIASFLSELDPALNVLVCTHGGTIKTVLSLLNQPELHRAPDYLDYVRVPLFGYN